MSGQKKETITERARPVKTGYKDIIFLFLMAAAFFVYFTAMTTSEYEFFPKGDSKVYTVMAIHFGDPDRITEKLPSIYTQRLFPAFAAYILSYPIMDNDTASKVTTPNRTQSFGALKVDQAVRRAWRVSNFIAYFVQLLFLYLILARFGVKPPLRYFMLAMYSMWFIPIRLYTNWIMMPDPWAFAFLSAASYFLITLNNPGFLIAMVLGVLSKEQVVFLAPAYAWRVLAQEGFRRGPLVKAVVIGGVPVAAVILLRAFPWFPSYVLTPNAPREAQAAIEGSGGFLSDYLFILKYHFLYRFREGWVFVMDSAFALVGTFAGLSCLVIWRIKDTLKEIKAEHYWIPFIFFTILMGFNVTRYVIYVFPPLILFSALILEERYRGRDLLYVCLFLAVMTVLHHEAWRPFTAENNLELTLVHQIELASDYGEFGRPLANRYRWLSVWTLAVTFAGLMLFDLVRRRRVLE